jgi:hypothetical protein
MVKITISLIGENGDSIVFDDDAFILETGLRGFGIPAPLLRIDKSAGDGGVYRFSKRDVRSLDLPITVTGSDNLDVETKLRRLSSILKGAVRLVATYETGEEFELVTYFSGGADTEFGEDAGAKFCRWVISLQAPQPFWTSTIPKTFSVAASTEVRGLLAAPSGVTKTLSALRVKTSQALGSVPVDNPGDVPSPPTWIITGPAASVSITLGGIGFSYAVSIGSGETITIDTETGLVRDASGVNKYASLGAAPKFFQIPSGSSVISITAAGADSDTKISGFFKPRKEVIH